MSQSEGISSPLYAMTLAKIFNFIIYGVLEVSSPFGVQTDSHIPKQNPFRESEYQLHPPLPGDFCLVQCLLLYHLRNKLVLDHPNANRAPSASVLLAPRVEFWTVIAQLRAQMEFTSVCVFKPLFIHIQVCS